MTLEDHAGDIIRKSRAMLGLRAEPVAKAAGLTMTDFDELEKTGYCSKSPNYSSLAAMLALDPNKLKRVAEGWLPVVPSLKLWRHLHRVTTHQIGMDVHAYIAWDEHTRECALFDTGFDAAPLLHILKEKQLNLTTLCITHAHPDHVAGMTDILKKLPKTEIIGGAKSPIASPEQKNKKSFSLGQLTVACRQTPGHAPDGCTFVISGWPDNAPHVAVVGDALFAGSMGGAGSNGELAKTKVREEILSLPGSALICPGHGPLTTVAQENQNNPFFL